MFIQLRNELIALIDGRIARLQKDTGGGGNIIEDIVDQIEAAQAPRRIARLKELREKVLNGTIALPEVRELLK